MRRPYALAGLGLLPVLALLGASAAGLGGAEARTVGADVSAVGACDTDGIHLALGAVSYDASSGGHVVGTVELSGIAPGCRGKRASVTLDDAAAPGEVAGSGSAVLAGPSASVALSAPVPVDRVRTTAVVITD